MDGISDGPIDKPIFGCFLCERRTSEPSKHEIGAKLADGRTLVAILCPRCRKEHREVDFTEKARITGSEVERFL